MSSKTWHEIEKTQQALRDSIEKTKMLARRSDELLSRHRREMREELPGNELAGRTRPAAGAAALPSG